jgi:hypothetical protein
MITSGVRTSYLDWCTEAEPDAAYVPSADYAVEVDLEKGIAYTRGIGRPLLRVELNPDVDEEVPVWCPEGLDALCKRCEHVRYLHSEDECDGPRCRCWGFKE